MIKKQLWLVMILLVGCHVSDQPEGTKNLTFSTENQTYNIGSKVKMTLQNNTGQTLYYNFCFAKLHHCVDEGWQLVGPSVTCQAIAESLKTGQKVAGRLALSDSLKLAGGDYRISMNVDFEDSDQNRTIHTPVFAVVEATP